MDPTFVSVFQGFPPIVLTLAAMAGVLLATLFIYSATASILLAFLTSTIGLVGMAWVGFVPW